MSLFLLLQKRFMLTNHQVRTIEYDMSSKCKKWEQEGVSPDAVRLRLQILLCGYCDLFQRVNNL